MPLRLLPLVLFATVASAATIDSDTRRLSRDIFKQLIEINTTNSVGNTTTAANAIARRLQDAGFAAADVQVLAPNDRKGNLVVRLHGTGAARPVLIIGHLDVVEARREDWTTDPFQFVEQGGYFYGRGTQDMKGSAAIAVTTFIRLHREGFRPNRDLILALTADEEGGAFNGVKWLLENHRDLVDAAFAINIDAGGVTASNGKPVNVDVEATEKQYADFQLTVTNRGGHSSLPTADNAIYHLADALSRLERTPFPLELNDITRTYFQRRAPLETGQTRADMNALVQPRPDTAAATRLSKEPRYNSLMRTTCVATRLNGGHANNALPQNAQAIVNCRILPGHSPAETQQILVRTIADPQVAVVYVDNAGKTARAPDSKGFPTVLPSPEVLRPLEQVAAELWPGAPIIPMMETGATDSIYTSAAGIPSYGISGIAIDQDDIRAHGRDERVRVSAFEDGVDFFYRFAKAMTR
ncbi:MAG TPA: M20/M25/M40 family metallo-hydrolase [Vicinamibacterales bacterium]|jgi:acetylornithine deacetylase/succinyl-diaminopimelate desuccinylase-like protein|nr:M20/M25/M40 family metallo-hydrolase [Vicinamibacterales bacterium]